MNSIPANLVTAVPELDAQEQIAKHLQGYLKHLEVEFTLEHDSDNVLIRLVVCPNKQRACGDRSYIIVLPDGDIHAGCHGGKCAELDWKGIQAAFGVSFDDYLKQTNQPKLKKQKSDPSARIVADAIKRDKFFHDQNGVGCVQTIRRGHPEVLKVRSGEYRNILRLRFTQATKLIAKREWLNNAIEQLDAIAVESAEQHSVFVRVGYLAGIGYVDLGDDERNIIEVTPGGWQPIKDAPVFFRRPKSMRPLPMPDKQVGSVEMLAELVNIAPNDLPLYLAFLTMVYHPQGAFPVVALIGGPGRAKSSTAKYTRLFVDPSNVSGSASARNSEDLLIAAQDKRLLTFDNLDHVTQQQSDDLCRLATGASFSRRTLFSDCDETTFVAKSPVLITSIDDVIHAADLLDRSIRFVLPELQAPVDELIQDAKVTAAVPKILGLILNGVSAALKNLPTTKIENPPRMVGFALWGSAAEPGLGLPKGSVMEAYRRNIADVNQLAIESDTAQVIIRLKTYDGTVKELAKKLGFGTSAKECRELVGQLRQLSSALAKAGVTVDLDRPLLHGCKQVRISSILPQ
jgi:hypothetical protein